MAMSTKIYRRTKIYAKTAVYDTDTICFHQAMKENDATQFLKAAHKKFVYVLINAIF